MTQLADVDLWDLDAFARGDGRAELARLREVGPVVWHDRPGGEPFWAVTSQAAARAVLRDPITFSSASAHGGMFLKSQRAASTGEAEGGGSMIETDPPRHQHQRRVLSPEFTPRSVGRLSERVREVAVGCIERARELGTFDFVAEVAHVIPATVTLELLGVPEEDWARLTELEHAFLNPPAGEGSAASGDPMMELGMYFYELLSAKGGEPGGDLLDLLLATPVEDQRRSVIDLIGEAVLLLNGGLDTTRAAASAGGLLPLLRDPAQMQALRDDPALLPTAVEEFVRWASPIRHVARTATADCRLGDVDIHAGDRIGIWLLACNRDAAVFEAPDSYRIGRHPNPHLGFSFGEHFCLGTHLARLILQVEFEEILRRWPTIELAGDPEGVRSNFVGGLRSLPVTVR